MIQHTWASPPGLKAVSALIVNIFVLAVKISWKIKSPKSDKVVMRKWTAHSFSFYLNNTSPLLFSPLPCDKKAIGDMQVIILKRHILKLEPINFVSQRCCCTNICINSASFSFSLLLWKSYLLFA